jgi:hypothetical protein
MLLYLYCEYYNTFDYYSSYQRLEINTIIVDQLYSYFTSVVTDYIYGTDTIDEKERKTTSDCCLISYGPGTVFCSLGNSINSPRGLCISSH